MSPEWQQKMREMIDRRTKENRMSDTVSAALEGLRIRERELEMDAVAIKARVDEIRDLIGLLEHGGRRRGRPRSRSTVIEMPERVEGGTHEPEEAA
jgi:hypothetical protein